MICTQYSRYGLSRAISFWSKIHLALNTYYSLRYTCPLLYSCNKGHYPVCLLNCLLICKLTFSDLHTRTQSKLWTPIYFHLSPLFLSTKFVYVSCNVPPAISLLNYLTLCVLFAFLSQGILSPNFICKLGHITCDLFIISMHIDCEHLEYSIDP